MFETPATCVQLLAQGPPGGGSPIFRMVVAAAIFLFVVLFALAVFGQRGQVKMTPEREVALAAGHADRNTVFEMSFTRPLMWLLLLTARRVSWSKVKSWLRDTLVAAGSPNFYTQDEFLAVALLWGIVTAVVLEALNALLFGGLSLLLPPIGLASGIALCVYNLHGTAVKRVRLISRRVPYTLDLIALAMGAGGTFTEAIRTVIHEDPEHPFNVELNTVLAEMELGTTRAQSLRNLSDRIPLEPLRSIVAAIIQAEALGTPLSDVLKEQSNLMRLQRSVRAEKLAAAASVRILVPSLLILVSVVLAVFAPFIIRAVKRELF